MKKSILLEKLVECIGNDSQTITSEVEGEEATQVGI